MAQNNKKCGECRWINSFSFKDGWCDCLLPNKNKRKMETRKITNREQKSCFYFNYK